MGITGEGTSPDELWDVGGRDAIADHLRELADARLDARSAEVGEADWSTVERLVLVRTIDSLWVEHLTELDDMRRGIGLRGYAQQDPLNEFRREAYRLYEELRGLIRHGVASTIFRVTVTHQPPQDPSGVNASLASGAAALAAGNGAGAPAAAVATAAAVAAPTPGSAILRGGPAAPAVRGVTESLGDQPVAPVPRPAGTARARPAAPAPATRRRAPGSAATTRAGADPAPSTRSATAPEGLTGTEIPTLGASESFPGARPVRDPDAFPSWRVGIWPRILIQNLPRPQDRACSPGRSDPRPPAPDRRPCPALERGTPVKQVEEASFVDLIACERDCRSCSYAAALDCDGNCGVCPHNGYCPCVNPVVARSKTALRLIELRPLLLQDLQARN